jgi:phage tail-like protein
MTMPADGVANCRFYVRINGLTNAVFTEMSGLQVETVVTEYEEGGNNGFVHRLPGRTKVGNLTLKRGIVAGNEFFKWYTEILQGKLEYRRVDVIVYDSEGRELSTWSFNKAFPVKWVGPQLAADGKNAAIETLEIAHDGFLIT